MENNSNEFYDKADVKHISDYANAWRYRKTLL